MSKSNASRVERARQAVYTRHPGLVFKLVIMDMDGRARDDLIRAVLDQIDNCTCPECTEMRDAMNDNTTPQAEALLRAFTEVLLRHPQLDPDDGSGKMRPNTEATFKFCLNCQCEACMRWILALHAWRNS